MLALWKKSYDKPIQHIKKQRYHFANKGSCSQNYDFSSNHVQMWVGPQRRLSTKQLMFLNCGVGEDSWEPLGLQGDQTSQSWRKSTLNVHWRTNAEAEALILWLHDVKSWLIGRDPDAEKDWRQNEKRATEDEMVRYHHQLNGHESEQTAGDSEGQGNLACCSPWGCKVRHNLATEQQ